ncbi:PucR family transcriptional regulator [[Mycobacterium] zoologicum]|uniref:PucR family transcriptional regulator n=1 Tax=[Mycobacterium] zoologicum TaxID=2872311 RepID=UPI001CDAA18B|nr:helix-turn-helix domain-containing protein [Mycolicibacter sp. MYC101]MEB3061940.1 helix-turn-helix domain-containing protein [Mycolicibacter sp. MYC101]
MVTPAAEAAQRLARETLLRSGQIAATITEQLLTKLPQLAPQNEPETVDALRESTDQNIGVLFSTLAFGVSPATAEPPPGARRLMRRLLASGADITDMLRAYRYGHELTWRHWHCFVTEQLTGSTLLPDVLDLSSDHMFAFIDRCCDLITAEYRRDFGGLRPAGLARCPAEVIRELLEDGSADENAASSVLHHDVGGYHVALVLTPVEATGDPRRAVEKISEVAGGSRLVLPVGDGTLWAWLTWPEEPSRERVDAVAATSYAGVLVAIGSLGSGRLGFRRSHEQARETEQMLRLADNPSAGVVRHRDVELACVLCTNPRRALRFATDRLGPLATADEMSERLRETLFTYLTHGCNKTRTASLLHVHYKTVTYRLAQAEELLGYAIDGHAIEVGSALLIIRTLRGC